PSPEPVPLPHFPSRLHAFIWRNWPLVPAEALAKVVNATPAQVRAFAQSMGLARQPRITREQLERSSLTVIRRNWHLLPYGQLLTLLGWTEEQLAYTLREDDFLYIKLGSLKPRCAPIRYEKPEATSRIREIVDSEFKTQRNREPLFAFLKDLSRSGAASPQVTTGLRLCYSYFSLYGDPLLDPKLDPYPDGFLARLAASGVNAVWLQGVLQKLAPFPWNAQRSRDYETRLRNLQRLAERSAKRGIRIYLYLNEPRTLPNSFFDRRGELKGVTQGEFSTLCTSQPEVQKYLSESVATICRAVPELGGFFTITASENLTNCWSHGAGRDCPRCAKRQPGEVISEVNAAVWRGIRDAGSNARLLAWDWGWADAWAEDAINRLPKGISLMSVSEWSLPIQRGGVETTVGEYSISAIGPGPRARRHWQAAQKRGLNVVAKIQAGNTWELSAVPYIPALRNVAQHARNLRETGIRDVMLGWTLGGYPSPNIEVVTELLAHEGRSVDGALQATARRRFGDKHAPKMFKTWEEVSAAFSEFPYHIGVVYNAPMQLGPANSLWEKPTGYRASMVGFPYDDLERWRSVYPADVFIAQMEKVASGVAEALRRWPKRSYPAEVRRELNVIEATAIHFQSTANQARFVQSRDNLNKATHAEGAAPEISTMAKILEKEIALAKRLHEIQLRDARIGFEASNQYYYVPCDLMEKVLNCRDLLDRWLPAQRAKWNIS
ncbi:MAG TPA: hypothetical protein VFC26_00715, partial [Verrucomicrobiae bacterium]|nr:hypothetical protein [Verrucomicrobiae bacterium]